MDADSNNNILLSVPFNHDSNVGITSYVFNVSISNWLVLTKEEETKTNTIIGVWKEEDSVRYGPQENLACSSRGNLDFYLPDLSVVAGEGFDHHAHWPLIPMDLTVLQQHKVPFLQVRSLRLPFPAAL